MSPQSEKDGTHSSSPIEAANIDENNVEKESPDLVRPTSAMRRQSPANEDAGNGKIDGQVAPTSHFSPAVGAVPFALRLVNRAEILHEHP